MSKIPWKLKVRNGVVKWPLKMLLQGYMADDFVYRSKVGFVPPWRCWLHDERISRFVWESLLGGTGYIRAILREDWIERMLRHLAESSVDPPAMVLNTMWGALSTELWLQRTVG
jgi:asparagine synthetase B (glutamine-hydrolysing)